METNYEAIILCIDPDCPCLDRGGVKVGEADTYAEAAQIAKNQCPPSYGWRVELNGEIAPETFAR